MEKKRMSGWSGYVEHAKKKHYFESDEGRSICGFATLTDVKVKNKFMKDDIYSYRPKTVCQLCVREVERKKEFGILIEKTKN